MARPLRLLACILLVATPLAATAQDIEIPFELEDLSAAEIATRTGFLTERLDDGRRTAQAWQYGWTGAFGVGLAASTVQAATASDGDERVLHIVGAVKSAGALAQMIADPLPARLGADPMRAVADGTAEGAQRRLAVGERLLADNAARAESRFSLRRHVEGVTSNVLGGAVIWALGDRTDALVSTLSGILVGELQIWSQPWRASGDLARYRATFPTTLASRGIDWRIRPRLNGVEVALRF